VNPFATSRGDSAVIGLALFSATTMIAHQVAGKATRDALFLSHYDVTELPKMVIVAAVVSLAAVLTMSMLLPRLGPARLAPVLFGVSAALFGAEWLLYARVPDLIAIVLYVHMAAFGAVLISGFWSLVNERFDPHSAKPRIARIAAAATLGGVLGGVIAERVSAMIDVRAMLLVLSVLHVMCMLGVLGVGRSAERPARGSGEQVRSGLQSIARSRYLQHMAALMALVATIGALLDYVLKAEASAHFTSGESLVGFFASFYAVLGVATFVLQTVLGPRMLQRHGIGRTIAVLPLFVLAGGLLGVIASRLWTAVLLRGAQSVLTNSFYRSSFELLYTPVAPEFKRPTKSIIDVGADRLGDMLGGGLVLLLLALVAEPPAAVVVAMSMVAAGAALWVVGRLSRGYVAQLAGKLRDGALSVEAHEVLDATTERVLAETTAFQERHTLMERVKALKDARTRSARIPDAPALERIGAPAQHAPSEAVAAAGAEDVAPLLGAIDALCSGDVERARAAMLGDFMDMRLVPYLVPLLGDDRLAEDARMELRWMVPRAIGQLFDALLDPDVPVVARQRIPGVLEVCHNPRAVHALLAGLAEPEFNVRYSCARALARMRARNPHLVIEPETVLDAVRREVSASRTEWETQRISDGVTRAASWAGARGSAVSLRLDHVFTVLGLVHDPSALKLSLRALSSSDPNLRGTALEYLENTLPEDIRRRLWVHLGVGPRPAPDAREREHGDGGRSARGERPERRR